LEELLGDVWVQEKQQNCTGAKQKFNARFSHLNVAKYSALTKGLLSKLYPKYCPLCNVELTRSISTRETAVRCAKCNHQASRTAYTPLHHLKLPLWVFSYLLCEELVMFPQVLSSEQIRRRLSCSKNTATLLKRRLQLFLNDLMPAIKEMMAQEIREKCANLELPETGDLKDYIEGKPVVHIDGLALFSATQRANGGRARWKHTGQTASVYLTDSVALEKGKYQIGTLCHTIALKGGPIVLESVPSFKQKHVQPLMDFLPENAPVFSDDGYPWLSRYNANHRSVNHTARAKDRKRNVWARNRWCRDSVHNNVAEGNGRIIKHCFIAGYSYVSPSMSRMYLGEYAALKGLRVYGLSNIIEMHISLGKVGSRLF